GLIAPHRADRFERPGGTVAGDQPRGRQGFEQRGVGRSVFTIGPLPSHDLTSLVHGGEQCPVVSQIDPVDEELIIDLPSHRKGRRGNVPAPGEASPGRASSGRAINLILVVLVQHVIDERGEGGLLCLILAAEGIRGPAVSAPPPLCSGRRASVFAHRLATDLTFTSFRRLGSHSPSRPAYR